MAHPAHKPSIDTCNACGKLFPRVSLRLCTGCSRSEDHRFQLIRDFLVEHDGAAVADIARGTGVSQGDIRAFMEGGWLVEVSTGAGACTCGGVGTRCRHCRSQLTSVFREMEATMRIEHERRAGSSGASDPDGADSADGRTRYVRRMRRID